MTPKQDNGTQFSHQRFVPHVRGVPPNADTGQNGLPLSTAIRMSVRLQTIDDATASVPGIDTSVAFTTTPSRSSLATPLNFASPAMSRVPSARVAPLLSLHIPEQPTTALWERQTLPCRLVDYVLCVQHMPQRLAQPGSCESAGGADGEGSDSVSAVVNALNQPAPMSREATIGTNSEPGRSPIGQPGTSDDEGNDSVGSGSEGATRLDRLAVDPVPDGGSDSEVKRGNSHEPFDEAQAPDMSRLSILDPAEAAAAATAAAEAAAANDDRYVDPEETIQAWRERTGSRRWHVTWQYPPTEHEDLGIPPGLQDFLSESLQEQYEPGVEGGPSEHVWRALQAGSQYSSAGLVDDERLVCWWVVCPRTPYPDSKLFVVAADLDGPAMEGRRALILLSRTPDLTGLISTLHAMIRDVDAVAAIEQTYLDLHPQVCLDRDSTVSNNGKGGAVPRFRRMSWSGLASPGDSPFRMNFESTDPSLPPPWPTIDEASVLTSFAFTLVFEAPLPIPGLMNVALVKRDPTSSSVVPFSADVRPGGSDLSGLPSVCQFGVHRCGSLPHVSLPIGPVIDHLGKTATLRAVLALASELRVVIVANDSRLLTAVSEALMSLMYPLRWQCAYIPLLPLPLATNCLQAPVPFCYGMVRESVLTLLQHEELAAELQHVVLVDVDLKKVVDGITLDSIDPERSSSPMQTEPVRMPPSSFVTPPPMATNPAVHTPVSPTVSTLVTEELALDRSDSEVRSPPVRAARTSVASTGTQQSERVFSPVTSQAGLSALHLDDIEGSVAAPLFDDLDDILAARTADIAGVDLQGGAGGHTRRQQLEARATSAIQEAFLRFWASVLAPYRFALFLPLPHTELGGAAPQAADEQPVEAGTRSWPGTQLAGEQETPKSAIQAGFPWMLRAMAPEVDMNHFYDRASAAVRPLLRGISMTQSFQHFVESLNDPELTSFHSLFDLVDASHNGRGKGHDFPFDATPTLRIAVASSSIQDILPAMAQTQPRVGLDTPSPSTPRVHWGEASSAQETQPGASVLQNLRLDLANSSGSSNASPASRLSELDHSLIAHRSPTADSAGVAAAWCMRRDWSFPAAHAALSAALPSHIRCPDWFTIQYLSIQCIIRLAQLIAIEPAPAITPMSGAFVGFGKASERARSSFAASRRSSSGELTPSPIRALAAASRSATPTSLGPGGDRNGVMGAGGHVQVPQASSFSMHREPQSPDVRERLGAQEASAKLPTPTSRAPPAAPGSVDASPTPADKVNSFGGCEVQGSGYNAPGNFAGDDDDGVDGADMSLESAANTSAHRPHSSVPRVNLVLPSHNKASSALSVEHDVMSQATPTGPQQGRFAFVSQITTDIVAVRCLTGAIKVLLMGRSIADDAEKRWMRAISQPSAATAFVVCLARHALLVSGQHFDLADRTIYPHDLLCGPRAIHVLQHVLGLSERTNMDRIWQIDSDLQGPADVSEYCSGLAQHNNTIGLRFRRLCMLLRTDVASSQTWKSRPISGRHFVILGRLCRAIAEQAARTRDFALAGTLLQISSYFHWTKASHGAAPARRSSVTIPQPTPEDAVSEGGLHASSLSEQGGELDSANQSISSLAGTPGSTTEPRSRRSASLGRFASPQLPPSHTATASAAGTASSRPAGRRLSCHRRQNSGQQLWSILRETAMTSSPLQDNSSVDGGSVDSSHQRQTGTRRFRLRRLASEHQAERDMAWRPGTDSERWLLHQLIGADVYRELEFWEFFVSDSIRLLRFKAAAQASTGFADHTDMTHPVDATDTEAAAEADVVFSAVVPLLTPMLWFKMSPSRMRAFIVRVCARMRASSATQSQLQELAAKLCLAHYAEHEVATSRLSRSASAPRPWAGEDATDADNMSQSQGSTTNSQPSAAVGHGVTPERITVLHSPSVNGDGDDVDTMSPRSLQPDPARQRHHSGRRHSAEVDSLRASLHQIADSTAVGIMKHWPSLDEALHGQRTHATQSDDADPDEGPRYTDTAMTLVSTTYALSTTKPDIGSPGQPVVSQHAITALDTSDDGQFAVSAGTSGGVHVWDIGRQNHALSIRAHQKLVTAVRMIGSAVVAASMDGSLSYSVLGDAVMRPHADKPKSVMKRLSRRLSMNSRVKTKRWKGHVGGVTCCDAFRGVSHRPGGGEDAGDAGLVTVSGGEDGTVRIWRPSQRSAMHTCVGHQPQSTVQCIRMSMDGRSALSGGRDGRACLWDVESGRLTCGLTGHTDAVLCVFADERRIITGGSDGVIGVWDPRLGKRVISLAGHASMVWSLWVAEASAGDAVVVSGGDNGTIKIWDLRSSVGSSRLTIEGHSDAVKSIAGDWTKVCTGGGDGTLRVWDFNTGALLCCGIGHSANISHVRLHETHVVTGSWDGGLRVWHA